MAGVKGYNHPGKKHPVVAVNPDGSVAGYFAFIRDAMNKYGIDRHAITKCCVGRQKTSHGLKWYYEEDFRKLWEQHDPDLLKWTPDPNRDRWDGRLKKGHKLGNMMGSNTMSEENRKRCGERLKAALLKRGILGRQQRCLPVRCLNDGNVFATCEIAAAHYGLKGATVRYCAHHFSKTRSGYQFRFTKYD